MKKKIKSLKLIKPNYFQVDRCVQSLSKLSKPVHWNEPRNEYILSVAKRTKWLRREWHGRNQQWKYSKCKYVLSIVITALNWTAQLQQMKWSTVRRLEEMLNTINHHLTMTIGARLKLKLKMKNDAIGYTYIAYSINLSSLGNPSIGVYNSFKIDSTTIIYTYLWVMLWKKRVL